MWLLLFLLLLRVCIIAIIVCPVILAHISLSFLARVLDCVIVFIGLGDWANWICIIQLRAAAGTIIIVIIIVRSSLIVTVIIIIIDLSTMEHVSIWR